MEGQWFNPPVIILPRGSKCVKWTKVMVVSSIPVEVMLYNQSDTKFPNRNVNSMQSKKLNLKSHRIQFCISTTYSIQCKLGPFNSVVSFLYT